MLHHKEDEKSSGKYHSRKAILVPQFSIGLNDLKQNGIKVMLKELSKNQVLELHLVKIIKRLYFKLLQIVSFNTMMLIGMKSSDN